MSKLTEIAFAEAERKLIAEGRSMADLHWASVQAKGLFVGEVFDPRRGDHKKARREAKFDNYCRTYGVIHAHT